MAALPKVSVKLVETLVLTGILKWDDRITTGQLKVIQLYFHTKWSSRDLLRLNAFEDFPRLLYF